MRKWKVFLVLGFLIAGRGGAATLVVDPKSANASDTGPGSRSFPLQTIAEGMNRLMPGDTLNIAGGVYREAIRIPRRSWSVSAPTTIQAMDGTQVLIKGSRIFDNWRSKAPGVWEHPLADQPQQVFVNGKPLRQLGGTIFDGYPVRRDHPLSQLHANQGGIWPARIKFDASELSDASFYFDEGAKKLLIRVDLQSLDHVQVEVSLAPVLLLGMELEAVTIRGISFEHASTTTRSRNGALALGGRKITVDRVTVRNVDGVGITASGEDIVIQNSRFDSCGQLGMNLRGTRYQLINNQTNGNNTRGFNKWWEAGGAKFVGQGGLKDSLILEHTSMYNNGDGLWFDWGNERNRVERGVFAFNTGFGIHYEASSWATIIDNLAVGNGQRGIYLIESRNSLIAHNFVAFNKLEGVAIIEEGRKDATGILDLKPMDNVVVANIVAWNQGSAVVLPGMKWKNMSDNNTFVVTNERTPPLFSMGWPTTLNPRVALAEWRTLEGQDRNSVVLTIAPSAQTELALRNKQQLAYPLPELRTAIANHRIKWRGTYRPNSPTIALGESVGPRRISMPESRK
ncbi:MAG TPA: right-handed parallel beta-helix repeat-containing protein [Candidatus Accumulibacter phosphatis]|nr:right-handed parallel beta-helix repeat-containing protein [Candidatus Accumulibacter phosphatis]